MEMQVESQELAVLLPVWERLRGGAVASSARELRLAAEELDDHGDRGAAAAYVLAGEAWACLGHVSAAGEVLDRAAALAARTGQRDWQRRAALAGALLAARAGRDDASTTAAVHQALLSGWALQRDRAELVQGVGMLARGQWDDGYVILRPLLVRPAPELVAWGLLSHLADAAVLAERRTEARAALSTLAANVDLFEDDITLAELMYATAVLSESEHADACFEAMLSHDPGRWPWLAARAHLAYGERLRRTRRVIEARGHLVTARRLFAAMGTPAWEWRAAGELRAAGVRDDQAAAAVPRTAVPLTSQELRIARMAASGMTNRQIGQVLYLSPRTVSSHLYRVFPKLDVTSRIQLGQLISPG